MSGIYGIYRYDGAPVAPQWLEEMRVAMAYYGPDGGSCKISGSIGLGHLLHDVNPEDAFENQPVSGIRGPVVSVARLDNRAALLETFQVSSLEAPRLSDGHLVSLAFDRWGEELCSHLEGDWALAAWDARERRLLLARDACGNANLYFYEGRGFVAFASSLKALLALPGVVKRPDRLRLAEVLVAWQHDAELTAYEGFRRVVSAHALAIDSEGRTRNWRHWSPEGRQLLSLRRDEEYEEAFLECYTRAVSSCLRTRKPVAATLSGGRDSGSVVTLAAKMLANQHRSLTAYTSVPCLPPDGAGPERIGNEWDLAHSTATLAGENVCHLPVYAAEYGVLQGIEHLLDVHDGPSNAPNNHYWIQGLTEAAVRAGAGVILNAQMGNATVSWRGNGSALLALLQGHPQMAMRLFLQADPSPWQMLKRQVLKPLLVPGLRAVRRLRHLGGRPWQAHSALNLQVAMELNIDDRMRAAGLDSTFALSPLVDARLRFFLPDFSIGEGIWSEMGAAHSVQYLDPTANQSLAEFLLRVPDDQFCGDGQDCWLFKRTFKNRLPALVLGGRHKGLQAADIGHRILRELPAFRERIDSLDSIPEAKMLLDLPLLRRCLEDLVAKVTPEATARASWILLRGLGVGLFLRRLAGSH